MLPHRIPGRNQLSWRPRSSPLPTPPFADPTATPGLQVAATSRSFSSNSFRWTVRLANSSSALRRSSSMRRFLARRFLNNRRAPTPPPKVGVDRLPHHLYHHQDRFARPVPQAHPPNLSCSGHEPGGEVSLPKVRDHCIVCVLREVISRAPAIVRGNHDYPGILRDLRLGGLSGQ